MSESEANAVAKYEKLEQAWIKAKDAAHEKQELMLLAIKTHLGGAGPAPSRKDHQALDELWQHEQHARGKLNDFASQVIG